MEKETAALPRQSGAISTALTALAGFTAGALVMGLLAFTRHPPPVAAESAAVPMSSIAGGDATNDAKNTAGALNSDRSWPGQADQALTWPFESGTRTRDPPGAKRPDRLSGPDGWTYDPRAEAASP
jgi:hypothetical protein